MKYLLLLLTFISLDLHAQALPKLAYVYGGDGACPEDCVGGAVQAAEEAGFVVQVVDPKTFDVALLKDASVWIQPGGTAVTASKAMGKNLMKAIKNFVKNGGGYVGFCAGAFIATRSIGTSWTSGLGIVPGRTILFKANKSYPSIEKMTLSFDGLPAKRDIYWEGGPYFKFESDEQKQVSIRGYYASTGQIGFIETTFGKGRVSVTGAHPEAPQWWRDASNLVDSDGTDYNYTTKMIQWAARVQ